MAIDDSGYTPTYTGAFNFVNGASQSNEYTYDKNGNLTKDLNKNILSIQYNFLNLPANITYSSGKSAAYIYDANGQKLRTSYKASVTSAKKKLQQAREEEVRTEMLHFTIGQFNSDAFDTFITSGFQRITDLLNGEE